MSKSRTKSIFLSYALADRPQLRKLFGQLKTMGIVQEGDELIDHAKIIVGSSAMREEVRSTIKKVDKVLVIWSEGGAASEWVNYEAAMADAFGKEIVVLVPKGHRSELPSLIAENTVVEMDAVH